MNKLLPILIVASLMASSVSGGNHLQSLVTDQFAGGSGGGPTTQPSDDDRPISEIIAKDIRPSVCRVVIFGANGQPKALGSGFVVSADGFIVTNNHVVEGASAADVEFPDDGSVIHAELWQTFSQYDLALLKISGRACKPLTISKIDPLQAEDVFTLGFPLSKEASLKVTRGIVSSMVDRHELGALVEDPLTKYASDIRFVQIDSAINHGNSGGPLINVHGEVIGVNTLGYGGGDSMFYAVSAEHVARVFASRPDKAGGYRVKAAPAEPTEVVRQPTKPKVVVSFPVSLKPEDLVQPPTKNRPPHTVASSMLDLIKVRRTICDRCTGQGKVTYEVQVGTTGGERGGMTYPVMEKRSRPCNSCNRTGRVTPKAGWVQQAVTRAVIAFAETDRELTLDDSRMADVARRWEAVVFENVVTFGDIQAWAAEKLKAPAQGSAVLTVGVVIERRDVAGRESYLVYTGTPDTYLITGQMHETRVTGDGVIVAGVIGPTIEEGARKYVVVCGGLVIDAPRKVRGDK